MTTEYEGYQMYALATAPPKQDLQEYIKDYVDTKDNRYIEYFLHYYENTINAAVTVIVKKHELEEHFSDVKQAYVMGILKALENYDITTGVPFKLYLLHYAQNEAIAYVRKAIYGFSVQSTAEFAKVRKIMAIWTENYNRDGTEQTIEKIATEVKEKKAVVKEIIIGALKNANAIDFYRQYYDTDGEESSEEFISDQSSGTEELFFKSELYSRLWKAFENLEYEERSMLFQYIGICPDCRGIHFSDNGDVDINGEPKIKLIKAMMFTDIATDHGYSQASTAKKICENALKKLKVAITDNAPKNIESNCNNDDESIVNHCAETGEIYDCTYCNYKNPDSNFCGCCIKKLRNI